MTGYASEPTDKAAEFDITLERLDTGAKIGFVLSDGQGKHNPYAVSRSPYPRFSLQTYQGTAGYDNQEPPYRTIIAQDWTGGRGQLRFESDATRYFDAINLHTQFSGKFFLGPNPVFTSGTMAKYAHEPPTSVTFVTLTGDNLWLANNFLVPNSGSWSVVGVMLYVRAVGSPGNLTVAIYSNSGSVPNASQGSTTIAASDVIPDHAELRAVSITASLSASTTYHIVVTNSGTNNADNYWQVGVDSSAGDADKSTNGTSWTTTTSAMWYVTWENTTAGAIRDIVPFVYKNQVYSIVRYNDKANSYLYMAGDRGAADSNAGDKSKLIDATKTWSVNAYTGLVVLITKGPGSEEETPYRTISSNLGTELTVSPNWKITHTTETEYVILGTSWTSLLDLGGNVTDYALAGDNVYFARGDSATVLRFQHYNNSGTWTARNDAESVQGTFLLAQREPDGDEYLWVAKNTDTTLGSHVRRLTVPKGWGDLYQTVKSVASTDRKWSEWLISTASLTVTSPDIQNFNTSGISVGDTFVSHDTDDTIDLREGTRVGTLVRYTGSLPTLTVGLSDTKTYDRKFQASKIIHASYPYRLPAQVLMVSPEATPAGMKYKNNAGSWYNQPNSAIGDDQYASRITIDGTSARLYIGHTSQFDRIRIDFLDSVLNNNASVLTAKAWFGSSWGSVSATDGTATGGASFGQDGSITWSLGSFKHWEAGSDDATNLSTSLYWIELSWSAALDATQIDRVLLGNSLREADTQEYLPLTKSADGDDASALFGVIPRFGVNDWLYVMGQDRFDEIKIDLGATVNAVGSTTMTVEYFNGKEFAAVTNLSDGTASGGTTLAQDGSVTFDLPNDMGLLTVNTTEGYVARLSYTHGSSLDLTPYIKIIEVSVKNRRHPVMTELEQCVIGNLASSPEADADVPVFASGDFLYLGGAFRFDTISMVINTTVKNDNTATLTPYYWDGENWISLSVTDGTRPGSATLAQSGDITFSTGADLMQRSVIGGTLAYWVRLKFSAQIDPVLIHSVALQRNAVCTVTITGASVAAGSWYFMDGAIPLFNTAQNGVDIGAIQSVTLKVTTAVPSNIEIRGGLLLNNQDGYVVHGFGPNSDLITGMELYGQGRQNPWVFTESGVFEIQTQLGNAVVPIPLAELSTQRSPFNGRATTTNDTYLYFNLGPHIQRYFNQTLDNIGWTREEGLPDNRKGMPTFMLSAPGGVYAGLDAGASGYSGLMLGQARAWNEIWLAPYGMSVKQGAIQVVPGSVNDRLWLSVGALLLYLPIASDTFDPTHDSTYVYTPEGSLITSWMSADLFTIQKLWKALSLYCDNLSANVVVHVSYQLESGEWDGTWTKLSDDFNASPVDEHDLAALLVKARRVRLRLNLRTNAQATTPIAYAVALDALVRFPTKFSYTFQHRIADRDVNTAQVPRRGLIATAWVDTLDDLANDLVACRVHSRTFPEMDGRTVVVEPSGMREVPSSRGAHKSYLLETTLLEV